MDTITEILIELEAMASTGALEHGRMIRAKHYIVDHPEEFLESEANPITIGEAADMAVELSRCMRA